MTPTYKESASDREILLVGPYGVLGTGVIDGDLVVEKLEEALVCKCRPVRPAGEITQHWYEKLVFGVIVRLREECSRGLICSKRIISIESPRDRYTAV